MREVPAFRLVAQPITDTAANLGGFPHASAEIGSRHRIGGEPSGPGLAPPTCDECRQPMSFYGQLDSIGEGFELADVGVVAVFVCFDCFSAKAEIRSS